MDGLPITTVPEGSPANCSPTKVKDRAETSGECRLESSGMSAVYIKNGTPVGSQSVCLTCEFAQILRGFRDSEELTFCTYCNPTILVPFPVRECSNYADKNKPNWEQMEKLAIEVRPNVSMKPVGFNRSGTGFVTQADDEEVAESDDQVVNK